MEISIPSAGEVRTASCQALAFFASMRGDTASPPRVVHPTRGAPDAVSYGAVASAAEKVG